MGAQVELMAKMQHFLDTNTRKEFTLAEVCSIENQAQLIAVIAERADYEYNGVTVRKVQKGPTLHEMGEYLLQYDYGTGKYACPYGHFDAKDMRPWLRELLKVAKGKRSPQQIDAERYICNLYKWAISPSSNPKKQHNGKN